MGFLSQIFTIHRIAGEGVDFLFNSSVTLSPASQVLKHQMGDCCRELTTVLSSRTRTGNIWFPSKIRYQLSYASLIKSAHKSCKRTFFKDSYLNSQPLIPSTPVESEALLTPNFSSTDQSLGLRKSSRQSLQYKSNQAERKCIICNKDRYTKDQ